MSFRRLISIGALAATAAVLPALPGQAAPSTGKCRGDYPTNASQLSLSVSPHTLTAGQASSVFGALRKNQCPIKGATIRIYSKRVVNGVVTGGRTLLNLVTTDRNGLYLTSVAPLHNVIVYSTFSGTSDGTYKPATSGTSAINVRTRITEAASKGSGCTITLTGATKPTKGHHTVTIQKRGARGHFHGWTNFARGTTRNSGRYTITKTAKCGTTYNLSAYIAKDATNLAGRSATIFGVKPHH
jgi:hypothetical protein